MTWLFLGIGAILVVGIALVAVGSAVSRLSGTLRPAVLEVDAAGAGADLGPNARGPRRDPGC